MGVRRTTRRRADELARDVLSGDVSGPAAATQATVRALAKVPASRAIVLVEGISDQIALEALAARRGRDLGDEDVVILPVGGAQAITRYLNRFGRNGTDVRLAGLCDAGEEDIYRRALVRTGIGSPQTRADMERLGFYVCVDDLEDELIRAAGPARVLGSGAGRKLRYAGLLMGSLPLDHTPHPLDAVLAHV